MLDAVTHDVPDRADEKPGHPSAARTGRLRLAATIFGLLGSVAAVLVPFLPVHQDVTTLTWPTAAGSTAVSAPLETYAPISLDVTMPCAAVRGLQARSPGSAVVLSTNPPSSPYADLTGLTLRTDGDQLALVDRGQTLGRVALPAGDCTITVHSDASGTTAAVGGQRFVAVQGDQRPQLTGIYSGLDGRIDSLRGVSVDAHVDTRYVSTPTALKIAAIAFALIAFAACVAALRRMDTLTGRRAPRWVPRGWWKPTPRDGAVLGTLVVWWLVGATTSDDGFIMTIARARQSAGYVGNYYRWFDSPEAPFGWPYEIFALMVRVSTATPWLRVPALLMGVASWLMISRALLPRLGQRVRRSHAASWAAAAVFLAFWMPFDNGLRPEPVVVVFWLLSYCAVERTLATRRLLPAALGLVAAGLALGANPHGLAAVLPYVAAIRSLVHLVRQRARQLGWVPTLAPILACGVLILTLVYSNTTWQSVLDTTRLRERIGPYEHWYQELDRYIQLFSQYPDGALARRLPVLLVILCLVTCMAVLLRRDRIRGAALGPSRRLLAITALTFAVLVITPTKWPHHFGIFAAVGGPLAALTALATSSTVLRSKRNRAAFFAALMVICAFATTGTNGFWYVSGWGVPWSNRPPSIDGVRLSTLLLTVAGIAGVVALVEHLRLGPRESKPDLERRSRALRWGTAPLSITCALLIVGELLSFAKAVQTQWGSYSLGADNVQQLLGKSCGLSDYVQVEANPLAGMLPVSPNQPTGSVEPALSGTFRRVDQPGTPPQDPYGTPPYGFGSDQAPVWGNGDSSQPAAGQLQTPWYQLPGRATGGQVPLVVTIAGAASADHSLVAEYGENTDHGFAVLARQPVPFGSGEQWRDVRLLMPPQAKTAQQVRLVAADGSLGTDTWMAFSAPRAPQVTSLTRFAGSAPTFIDWPAAFVQPCLQVPQLAHGVAEAPRFRIAASPDVLGIGQNWSSPDAGGPYGWIDVVSSARLIPTYLKGDLLFPWGTLYQLDPYDPNTVPAQAAMHVHTETHWGTWSPGPIPGTIKLPATMPKRNDLPEGGSGKP